MCYTRSTSVALFATSIRHNNMNNVLEKIESVNLQLGPKINRSYRNIKIVDRAIKATGDHGNYTMGTFTWERRFQTVADA